MASSGGGKTNDEIVFDLAESILNKIPEKLDLELAAAELFEVSPTRRCLVIRDGGVIH